MNQSGYILERDLCVVASFVVAANADYVHSYHEHFYCHAIGVITVAEVLLFICVLLFGVFLNKS